MEYNLKDHGDRLEKAYVDFIRMNFPTYEAVWSIYIGNRGDDTKAEINGYNSERDKKRQDFSEHTYTILQSIILLNRLLKNNILDNGIVNNVEGLLDLQDFLLLFFTHLGRIKDNVEAASMCLINCDTKDTTLTIEEFYHKRHLFVHGKMLPIMVESSGEIFLPILSKDNNDPAGWNHKRNSWQDLVDMDIESLSVTASQLYWGLLPKVCDIFGKFKSKIQEELSTGCKLVFEYQTNLIISTPGSGSSSPVGLDVYGLMRASKK